MTSREKFKSVIRKIVLTEIQRADYGVGKYSTATALVKELNDVLHSVAGDHANVIENPVGNKIVFDDGEDGAKFQVELYRKNDKGDRFDLTAFFQGSERMVVKDMTKESVIEFIKDNLKTSENCPSYTEKALSKGKAPVDADFKKYDKNTDKAKKVSADDDENEESEADEETQKDIADKDTTDADGDEIEIDDELAPVLGGELIDKIEKIVDRLINKKVNLKADKDKESSDKLTSKMKETPALKEKKK